jgi:hypothetical protein
MRRRPARWASPFGSGIRCCARDLLVRSASHGNLTAGIPRHPGTQGLGSCSSPRDSVLSKTPSHRTPLTLRQAQSPHQGTPFSQSQRCCPLRPSPSASRVTPAPLASVARRHVLTVLTIKQRPVPDVERKALWAIGWFKTQGPEPLEEQIRDRLNGRS